MYRLIITSCLVSFFAGLIILASPSLADSYPESPSCSKPYKPFEYSDEYEYENFIDEVKEYKRCIMNFIEEQNEAIRNHQEAAQEAINEWDNFVSLELN